MEKSAQFTFCSVLRFYTAIYLLKHMDIYLTVLVILFVEVEDTSNATIRLN